jgi:oligopeptide/dipeptide ABC transporter ATP-binding protein
VNKPIIEIKDLKVYFYVKAGTVKAVDGVNLTLEPGTKLGLVGESGSGKTTMALALMRMVRPPMKVEGQLLLDGVDLITLSEEEMRRTRLNEIAMIPQGAMNSLNPVAHIKDQILDGMYDHGEQFGRGEAIKRVYDLLEIVELPKKVADMYPHELSGGMKQRVTVAIAISMHPKVLIADEPTSALDVVTQRQVMETITRLVHDLNLSMILIGHDMGLMAQSVDRIAVMYPGKFMEVSDVNDIFADPQHPYTQAMIDSLPTLGKRGVFHGIQGIPPSVINPGPGCPFFDRCPKAMPGRCEKSMPPFKEYKSGRWVACYLYEGAN